MRVCLCVCLTAAACPLYCTDPDVTWGYGRGCLLVVHYWTDLQSVHGFHCYDNMARTRNVSKCLYSLCTWLLLFILVIIIIMCFILIACHVCCVCGVFRDRGPRSFVEERGGWVSHQSSSLDTPSPVSVFYEWLRDQFLGKTGNVGIWQLSWNWRKVREMSGEILIREKLFIVNFTCTCWLGIKKSIHL